MRANEGGIEMAAGDCLRVEAKKIFLAPADELQELANIGKGLLKIE